MIRPETGNAAELSFGKKDLRTRVVVFDDAETEKRLRLLFLVEPGLAATVAGIGRGNGNILANDGAAREGVVANGAH